MGLALAVPFLLPADIYKEPIEQGVSRATGHAFAINGPLRFTFFPAFAVEADRVSLANVPGGQAASLATAKDVRLGIRLWPLLSGRLEIAAITIDQPLINLEVNPDGTSNWTLRKIRNGESGKGNSRIAFTTSFSDITIARGQINYANLRTGAAHRADDINAAVSIADRSQWMAAKGSLVLSGKHTDFEVRTADPSRLMHGQAAKVSVSAATDVLRAQFSGSVQQDWDLNGDIDLNTPSLRAAAEWIGARLPDSGGFATLSLTGHVAAADHDVALTGLAFTLDNMHGKGVLTIGTNGKTPKFDGALDIDHLDLNPYIEHPRRAGTKHQKHDGESWSSEPIALDILHKADADLYLSVGDLSVRKLKLGRTKMKVSLDNARLHAELAALVLYRGNGTATLDIDARSAVPAFHDVLDFNAVALQPFLSDAIGVNQIEGTGNIRLDVESAGVSADAIMRNIRGSGTIAFRDGQLRGVDLGAVARTIRTFLGAAINPDAFTGYTTMSGSFVAANGVLTSNDFHLAGPVLDTSGSGTVDVGNRAIDFRIVPKAPAVIAKQKLSLGVPFRIRGPWKHVHYNADITGIVNGVLDNLKSGKAPFKGLFGPSQPKDPNAPKKKHKNIGDALKNMLGIH